MVCYRCGVYSLPRLLHSCVAASKAFCSCSLFYHHWKLDSLQRKLSTPSSVQLLSLCMRPCMFTRLQNSPSTQTWEANRAASPASQACAKLKKGRFKRCCFLLYKEVPDTDTAVAEVSTLPGATLTPPTLLTRFDMGVSALLCRVFTALAILSDHHYSLIAAKEN